ncbi:tyrosine-type recombinase/integrase [Rhizobium ruizarguesonis]|uniref:tyrosine-type recombinase/integrase n=1 Tax=Rhizobium ruizarguesonis TaxID=2081791 RepID=UPI001030CEC8|nr:site-specific integrase [Rhizobium ruizarguesonis]TBD81026.1 site-specific integrase [Rhizobium ruizarguesonis]TBE12186.1 site-specific integrase [Rhizobium ruizarguesonis]WSH32145.1 site-specific integrase [Rhizobium ruizarguesonis]
MSVYKPKASPYYLYDFQVSGNRFHGSTKARNKRDAEAIERTLKEKAKQDAAQSRKTGNAPLTIDVAVGRYWTEVAQHLSNNAKYFASLERLVSCFGKDCRLDDIDDDAIIRVVAHKRQQLRWGKTALKNGSNTTLSNATINRETLVPLKTIFRRAKTLWRYPLPNEPIWKEHFLKEPRERVRELHAHEQLALEQCIREDYRLWFHFLQLSGRRFHETLIKWSDVNWEAGEIMTFGKGEREVWTPITASIREILEACRGHHEEFVFTFVATRTKQGRTKGQRYPMNYHGTMTRWRRDLKASGVVNFRLHDNRHDTATKVLRQTKNLKIVQRLLNHANLTTTGKYAHVMDDEVASALENNAESRKKSRGGV